MARLFTCGWELRDTQTGNTSAFDMAFAAAAGVTPTISTSTFRSGSAACQCASGAGNGTSYCSQAMSFAASTTYYQRCYFNFSQIPGTTAVIMQFGLTPTNGIAIKFTTGGLLQLWDIQANVQIGSSSVALSTGQWYRVEMSVVLNASFVPTTCTAQLDGAQFATGTATTASSMTGVGQAGWVQAPGANSTLFMDDYAVNDSNGGSQNTFPGSGSIVLLLPTADSAGGTGWRLGTNTALGGNGWNSVNNKPPLGVADLAVGSDPKQIRNATSNANDSFDATMTSYTAAGVTIGSVVNVVDPIIATGAPTATGAKQGTVGVVSNPTIANVALGAGGTSGAFWSGVAAGTYDTGWKWSHGTVTYAPSVTLGTAPVMRVTQVTSSTRIAMVCFMGMYVDFLPGPVRADLVALQAMNRATNF